MNARLTLSLCAAALITAGCSAPVSESEYPAPHLEKRGEVTQLIVKGEPFLALACELGNSSSSSAEYMVPHWKALKQAGINTALAVVTWEMIEPEQGKYDFSSVDRIVAEARENDLKLCLLWFGSWKNGMSSYQPLYIKLDSERYPLAETPQGKKLPILSSLGAYTRDADAAAYRAMMAHLREIDSREQTVVMMQMQNEVGLHGHSRDYCPAASKAFVNPVPQQLLDYLSEHKDSLLPETLQAWEQSGCATSGTWEQVFGKNWRCDEIFMAWNYASYMNYIAAEGKKEYDIPVFVNAWIVQPEDTRAGNYPSGGPQAQNHDIYRAAAPSIDILSPDIYLDDFPQILEMYSRSGNPVFIPESRDGQGGAANAAYAIGAMGAIGYSPFGFERRALDSGNETFSELYRLLDGASAQILSAQSEGRIGAAWLKGSSPERLKSSVEIGDYIVEFELVSSGRRNGGAPQLTGGTYDPKAIGYGIAIQESEDSFFIIGSNTRVTFRPRSGSETVGLAYVREGRYEDGEWKQLRMLNGDEIQLRYDVLYAIEEGYSGQGLNFGTPHPGSIRVQLYKY